MQKTGIVWTIAMLSACGFDSGSGPGQPPVLTTASTTQVSPSTSSGSSDETGVFSSSSGAVSTSSSEMGAPETTGEEPDFRFRRRLTFATLPPAPLQNVIVRVSLHTTRMSFDNAQPTGSDIVFFSDDLLKAYPYEVDFYDGVSRAELWVRVDEVGNGPDGFWMYYGATGAVSPPDAQDVWGDRFSMVLHLETTAVTDSTAAAANGVNLGTTPTPGIIGQGRSFENGSLIDLVAGGLSTESTSVSFWFRRAPLDAVGPEMMFFAASNPTSPGFTPGDAHMHLGAFAVDGGAHLHVATASADGGPDYTDDVWHQAFATWRPGGAARLYIDGALVSQAKLTAPAATLFGGIMRLGASGATAPAYPFTGQIDEFRIMPTAADIRWIELDYESQFDRLLMYGPEEGT